MQVTELRKEKQRGFVSSLRVYHFDLNSVWGACSRVDLGDSQFFLSNVAKNADSLLIYRTSFLRWLKKKSRGVESVFSLKIHMLF